MIEDKKFNEDMESLLAIFEQGGESEVGGEEKPATGGTGGAPTTGGPTPSKSAQSMVGQKAKYDFLHTKNLFTTAPPPKGDRWAEEDKPMFKPLVAGKVGQYLARKFRGFLTPEESGHSATRYSDNQFRIILVGVIKFNAKVRVEAGTTESKYFLEQITMATPWDNNYVKNEEEIRKHAKPFSLKVDSKELYDLPKGEGEISGELETKENAEQVRTYSSIEEFLKEKGYGEKDIEDYNALTKQALKNVWQSKEVDEEIRKKHDMLEKPLLENVLRNVKALLKEYPKGEPIPREELDAAILDAIKEYVGTGEVKENYKVSLDKYITNLLNEQEAPKKAKKTHMGPVEDSVEEIVAAFNKSVYERWFGSGRIATTTRKRVFEPCLLEFFAVENANYRPKNYELKENGNTVQVNLEGEFQCDGEIWVDARIAEKGRQDTWTFRVHDKPGVPFARRTFGPSVALRGFRK